MRDYGQMMAAAGMLGAFGRIGHMSNRILKDKPVKKCALQGCENKTDRVCCSAEHFQELKRRQKV